MSQITVKRDPYLFAFAGLLVVVVGGLVGAHVITWREAAAFLGGALALPGLFGAAEKTRESLTPPEPPAPPTSDPEVKR